MRGPSFLSLPHLIFIYIHSDKVPIQFMKINDWHLEGALQAFYSQEYIKAATEKNRWEMLFNKYKGQDCLLKSCKLDTIYLFDNLLIFILLYNSFLYIL